MNILFVNSSRTWGGGERWLMDICAGLRDRGHSVYVICQKESALEDRISTVTTSYTSLNITGDFNPFTVFDIYRLIKQWKIQLVCTNFEKDLRIGGMAARAAGVPVILSREVDIPIKNKWITRLFFSRIASGILVNSYATLNTLLVSSPWLKQQCIEVVWKGIGPYSQRPEEPSLIRQMYKLSDTRTLVGFVGRIDEQKGIPTLLDAMRMAVIHSPDLTLMMAGEGNMTEQIEEYTRTHHLEENIILAGFQKNVESFLRAMDFVVIPSYWEGFGYAALEAMALKKAIVATHASSLPEIIEDGRTGILVPPRSAEKLAEAILTLAGDPGLREKMGRAGAERVKQTFTLQMMVSKTEKFFETIIGKGSIQNPADKRKNGTQSYSIERIEDQNTVSEHVP